MAIGDDRYTNICLVSVVNVKNTSTLVMPPNPERKMFFISNDVGAKIYFAFKPICTVGSASFFINGPDYFQWQHPRYFYTGPVSAIRTSGNSDVVVTEFL